MSAKLRLHSLRAACVFIALTLGAAGSAQGQGLFRAAASFDRSAFTDPAAADSVRAAGNLRGAHCCVSGWAEYDFDIPAAGWYQLWVSGGSLEYLIDPPDRLDGEPAAYFTGGSGMPGDPDKVGNVWLDQGRHRVRVQTYLWYGFSDLRSIELRRSGDAVEESVSIPWPRAGQIFRAGQCPRFELLSGNRKAPAQIAVMVRDAHSGALVGRRSLELPVSESLVRHPFEVPCAAEGFFRVSVAEIRGHAERDIVARGVKGFEYQVVDARKFDTRPVAAKEEAVFTIDCTLMRPDYGSGDSSVVESAAGRYRQSGDRGWVAFQRAPEKSSRRARGMSWFAYVLPGLMPGTRYRIDIDYPDDADRTFGMFLREATAHGASISIGADTGGPFPLSGTMQTTGMSVWPRTGNPRLVFAPAHDGTRAACSRIRVARLTPNEPRTAVSHPEGAREFVHWYEEGVNFAYLFGAKNDTSEELAKAAERWAGTVAEFGGTTLMPTVLVYGNQLYPSRYNLMEMFPDKDPLRNIMLSAERFGLKVIPELHPRADELMYGKDVTSARSLLLISKDGADNYFAGDGHTRNLPPHYNVLLPEVQQWLVDMIGELADRYRDSPAFEGISLRVMTWWSNAALDNLVDLNWGYSDRTVAQFEQDTGQHLPAIDPTDPHRFGQRHEWLTTQGRAAWVDWRCRQITSLMRRIGERIRRARPDLKLYVHAFPSDENRPYSATDTPRERLHDAGLDVDALAALPGTLLIDSSVSYGRNLPSVVDRGLLDTMRDPAIIKSLRTASSGGRYLESHRYVEATGDVVSALDLGFAPSTAASYASVAAKPVGPLTQEPFARALAEGDGLTLGDGGNGYIFNRQEKQFISEYTGLPQTRFLDVDGASSEFSVREATQGSVTWLYAVSKTSAPLCLDLILGANVALHRLQDEALLAQDARHLLLRLPPYGLVTATSAVSPGIKRVSKLDSCQLGPPSGVQ